MAQQTALSVLGTPGRTQTFVSKEVVLEGLRVATEVGPGLRKKKGRDPFLPDPISFRKRKQEWKAHVADVDQKMQDLHTTKAKALRQAVESERPKESVESQRARTRRHKKSGLEVQRPEFNKEQIQTPQPPRPKITPLTPRPEPPESLVDKRVREIKLRTVEKRVEKGMVAEEKRLSVEKVEARARRKKSLISLEFAKEAKAKKQAVEDARNKVRLKNLKKARAAKKRKRQKK